MYKSRYTYQHKYSVMLELWRVCEISGALWCEQPRCWVRASQDIRCVGSSTCFPAACVFSIVSQCLRNVYNSHSTLQFTMLSPTCPPPPACSVHDDCYCLYCDCLESVWCLLYKLSPEQKTLSKHYEHYDGLESRPAEHNYSSPGHGRGASDPRTAAPAQQLI